MKKLLVFLMLSIAAAASAQNLTPDNYRDGKRETKRNLTIVEWNTDSKTGTRWKDRQTTYDSAGRKVETVEYARYGQKWRETYEYGENDRICREVYYNEKDKPELVRKYEYDADGRKVRQLNYAPNGKLMTTKVFEYIVEK